MRCKSDLSPPNFEVKKEPEGTIQITVYFEAYYTKAGKEYIVEPMNENNKRRVVLKIKKQASKSERHQPNDEPEVNAYFDGHLNSKPSLVSDFRGEAFYENAIKIETKPKFHFHINQFDGEDDTHETIWKQAIGDSLTKFFTIDI